MLATLAILVWHLYWVIFDPAEFPMNPAWLIGKKAGHQDHAEGQHGEAPHAEGGGAEPGEGGKPEGGG